MSAGNLLRLSGLAGIAAGLLISISEVFAVTAGLMNMAEMARTPLSGAWVPLNVLQMLGLILMLLAFIGLYARQTEAAGILGLVSFVIAFAGTIFFVGAGWTNAFSAPVVARLAPALLERAPPSPLSEALTLSALLFAVGLILFGFTTFRAGVAPRAGALLLMVGGILSRIVPILDARYHVYVPVDSWVTSLGLVWLGYALWSTRADSTESLPV